jgi:four helix bundle protein
MIITRFEDISSWQKARELTNFLHITFKDNKDYSFKDQLFRALVSILNNIAEGFERNTDKELKYFLYIAKGSCGEVRSMLYLALDFKYITQEQYKTAYDLSISISQLLSAFIKKL